MSAGRLRVASYNIHGCVGGDHAYAPDRVAAVIRELDPDIVGLQEVDSRRHPGGTSSQLEHLGREVELTAIGGPTIREGSGEFGNALLTRCRVGEVRRHRLGVSGREPRAALDVDLELQGGGRLRVIVTHLGLQSAERRRQVRWLLEVIQTSDRPVVLLGDLNEWLGTGRALRRLNRHFGRTPAPRTFPARFPLFALDRVWAHPRRMLRDVRAHRSRLSRVASDHLPVLARLVPEFDASVSTA